MQCLTSIVMEGSDVEIIHTPGRERLSRAMLEARMGTRQSRCETTMQAGMADKRLLFGRSFATEMKFKVKGRSWTPANWFSM